MALDAGDVIVCSFHRGHQANLISLAPDQKIAILDRRQETAIEEHVPYVCTVRLACQKEDQVRSYIVHADRLVRRDDYDAVLDADFEAGTLSLGLRYPTRFASLRRTTVQAEAQETHIPARGDRPEGLVLRLRHGKLHRSLTLSKSEALQRGLRFNHFVKVQPPDGALDPWITAPIPVERGDWTPSLQDHTAYLFQDPATLQDSLSAVRRRFGDDALLAMARRRIASILAMACYEPVELAGPGHVEVERALAFLSRITLSEYRGRLADADRRLAQVRLALLGPAALASLAKLADLDVVWDGESWSCPVLSYVRQSHRRHGAWALCNRRVQSGRVHLQTRDVGGLLADKVHEARLQESIPAPDSCRGLVEDLQAYIAEAAVDLEAVAGQECPEGLVLEALPPCVAHALRQSLKRSLSEPEAYNAGALLCRTGLEADKVHLALHGHATATPGQLRTRTTWHRRNQHLRPPPCSINKTLGICAWTCPGITSPLEYYAQEVAQ